MQHLRSVTINFDEVERSVFGWRAETDRNKLRVEFAYMDNHDSKDNISVTGAAQLENTEWIGPSLSNVFGARHITVLFEGGEAEVLIGPADAPLVRGKFSTPER